MAQLSKAQQLLRKGEAALMAGIEIYNKPDFPYREETFAILALNGWELLLKAKLLHERSNDLRCLHIYEHRELSSGRRSTKLFLRRNRTGNPHTIGLVRVISMLENEVRFPVPSSIKNNLEALTEIRDNAVHYINASAHLAKQVLEIGTACVKNFVMACREWFNRDLSRYNLYLMPIGFIGASTATALPTSPSEKNLVVFLSDLVRADQGETADDYNVALEINLSIVRSSAPTAIRVTRDPNATPVVLQEEDIRKQYPWDYKELTLRARGRYSDFKENMAYHGVRKLLMQNTKFCHKRLLDPGNERSLKKDYYSPSILEEFDKHYSRH